MIVMAVFLSVGLAWGMLCRRMINPILTPPGLLMYLDAALMWLAAVVTVYYVLLIWP